MTEKERRTRSVELADAFDRAIMAGLLLRQPDEGQRLSEVTCPVCGATMMLSVTPWRPVMAARRLNVFALRHFDHDSPGPDDPAPGSLDHAGTDAPDQDDTVEET
jgi:hypothetical protein